MKNTIEPLIFNNIKNWISNPDFFLNVKQNINYVLSDYGVYFNGYNIIFNTDTEPELFNGEIASYITNEITYDEQNNIVIREYNNYLKINEQIDSWINKKNINDKTFGVSVHKLLRYLVKIGDEFNELIKYFVMSSVEMPNYIYNNPIKFIINKLWDKYNKKLDMLNKNFTNTLTIFNNFDTMSKIIGGVLFLSNLDIYEIDMFKRFIYMYDIEGTYLNEEFNITHLFKKSPNLLKPINIETKLISKPIYPYKINFNDYQINTNSTYLIDFLNGNNILNDFKINDNKINYNQLEFSSEYNIKHDDFIVVKEKTDYNIILTEFLGYMYQLDFSNININLNLVDNIYYRNYQLNVISKTKNKIIVLIPLSNNENIELRPITWIESFYVQNILSIKNKKNVFGKIYIEFYNSKPLNNFIENRTFLVSNNNSYLLRKDNNGYYLDNDILEMNVELRIIRFNNIIINDLRETQYVYTIEPSILETKYNPNNNNLITPLEFKLKNDNLEITPININSINNNKLILSFSLEDNNIINKNYWNKIQHIKQIDQIINNKIENIELINEFLYFYNLILPFGDDINIFLYEEGDIDENNFEPLDITKKSIFINKTDNATYFTIEKNYNDLTNIRFIQSNNWIITEYQYNDNYITIKLPDNFVYKSDDKYHYKFNNKVLNKNSFVFNNGFLIFDWDEQVFNNILFQQYYIETEYGLINIPKQNRKVNIELNYPYQYNTNNKFYINPYSGNGNEFNQYLYILETKEKTDIIDHEFKCSYLYENITLNSENGDIYMGKIFDELHENNKIYYIISLSQHIDTNINYTYFKDDDINHIVISLSFYQNSLLFGDFYKQTEQNKVSLFVNKSIHKYNYNKKIYSSITAQITIFPQFLLTPPLGYYYINPFQNKLYKSNGIDGWVVDTNNSYHLTAISSFDRFFQNKNVSRFINENGEPFKTSGNRFDIKYDNKYITTSNDGTIIFDNVKTNSNKFYLVSYNEYTITNIFNEDKFIQNDNMKRNTSEIVDIVQNTEIPIWKDSLKIFEYISFYFNEQLVDTLNEDVSKFINLYYPYEKKEQFLKISKIRFTNNKWEFYLPLLFWFLKDIGLSLPIIALPYMELKLKFKLNNLENILENKSYTINTLPKIKISLLNTFILLDTEERKLFGSYSHEYIIERNKIYPSHYIYDASTILPVKFSGLIKDICLVTKLLSNKEQTYISNSVILHDKRDTFYKRYLQALEYYNEFIKNNVYTNIEQKSFADDIDIILENKLIIDKYYKTNDKNINEFNDINNLYNFFSNFKEWNNDFFEFLYYYQKKYLKHFNDYNKINSIITTYIKYKHNKTIIYDKIPLINKLTIKANGENLFSERDASYFTNLIPVTKYNKTLETGYLIYTFSLDPQNNQFSGHLNFSNFDDMVIKIKSNKDFEPYQVNILVREYNILRIMSGIASLGWI